LGSGNEVIIASSTETPWRGDAQIHIDLKRGQRNGIRAGTWKIELEALKPDGAGMRFDAWIERTPGPGRQRMPSHFKTAAENRITLTTPGTARRVITVGSYDDKDIPQEEMSTFSGRGKTRDGREKPEIVAPGHTIYLADKVGDGGSDRFETAGYRGTSMAAPHVTGVVARLLSRHEYLFATEIRDILMRSATPIAGIGKGKWDPKWGYGRLNALAAMQLLDEQIRGKSVGAPRHPPADADTQPQPGAPSAAPPP
jgi:subtilisin family serine protease